MQGLTGNLKTEEKLAAHSQTFHSLRITSVSITQVYKTLVG